MTKKAEFPALHGLYAITPDWGDTRRLLSVTESLLGAGCRIVQYRNKTASACHCQEQAVALRGLTARHDALLIVNDELELAAFCNADGVHLGADDGDLAAARSALGPHAILGASCYQDLALAVAAQAAGADYVAFGSMYPSPTKPQARRADPALFAAARTATGLPVCAIGGITPDNAAPLVAAGADLLAVISALYDAPDPAQAARHFCMLFAMRVTAGEVSFPPRPSFDKLRTNGEEKPVAGATPIIPPSVRPELVEGRMSDCPESTEGPEPVEGQSAAKISAFI